jgi:hypothetical protein
MSIVFQLLGDFFCPNVKCIWRHIWRFITFVHVWIHNEFEKITVRKSWCAIMILFLAKATLYVSLIDSEFCKTMVTPRFCEVLKCIFCLQKVQRCLEILLFPFLISLQKVQRCLENLLFLYNWTWKFDNLLVTSEQNQFINILNENRSSPVQFMCSEIRTFIFQYNYEFNFSFLKHGRLWLHSTTSCENFTGGILFSFWTCHYCCMLNTRLKPVCNQSFVLKFETSHQWMVENHLHFQVQSTQILLL